MPAPGAEPPPPKHDPFAALREPNYTRFASGWIFSTMGARMQGVAVTWELYERTHSQLALGYVGLSQALPVILLALVGGHAADVHDRRTLVIASQMAYFLCSLGLAAVSLWQGPVWVIYGCLVLSGAAKAFNSPARGALLPLLVPKETFHNAVTWNSSIFQAAAIGGPVLAGLMLGVYHAAWPVCLLAAGGALAFALSMTAVRPRAAQRMSEPRTLRTLFGGFAFLRQERTVLAAITLDLFAVLIGGATALLPVFAKDILHVGPRELGFLNAAPYVGALIAAQVLAHIPGFKRAGPVLLWSVAGFGLATIGFGLSTNFWLSLALLALLGGLDGISVVVRHVLVQVRTPDSVRGRVAAVNSVFIESSNELGAYESGLVAHLWSPMVSVVSGGIGTLVVVAGIALAFPALRRLGTLKEPD
ncbi:MAG: MFS transporter [Phycisphaerales bacterium]